MFGDMKLDEHSRVLIGSGADATLVTLNTDGSPQVSVVWVAVQATPDGDEIVTAHLGEHKKVRNVRRDGRVALTILSEDRSAPMTPYLLIYGTARIQEGGAPELLRELAKTMIGPDAKFPPMDDPPAGFLTRIRIDKVGGVGPWAD
jgi:PPOX class probable F420-dependent enzyme